MNMNDAISKMVTSFGPQDKDLGKVITTVMKFMPNKDVPDETMRKIMALGHSLKKVGVK